MVLGYYTQRIEDRHLGRKCTVTVTDWWKTYGHKVTEARAAKKVCKRPSKASTDEGCSGKPSAASTAPTDGGVGKKPSTVEGLAASLRPVSPMGEDCFFDGGSLVTDIDPLYLEEAEEEEMEEEEEEEVEDDDAEEEEEDDDEKKEDDDKAFVEELDQAHKHDQGTEGV